MVNAEDFIKRLEILLDYYSLSASVFADKMGVQRSGLSHLMSGRNKPSLDFVMKIIENFPEVDLYWLLNGEGTFPKKDGEFKQPAVKHIPDSLQPYPASAPDGSAPFDLFSTEEQTTVINETEQISDLFSPKEQSVARDNEKEKIKSGEIEKIVVFYNDGTFKSYTPKN